MLASYCVVLKACLSWPLNRLDAPFEHAGSYEKIEEVKFYTNHNFILQIMHNWPIRYLTKFVHADPGDRGRGGETGDDQRREQHHLGGHDDKDILLFKRRHWRGETSVRETSKFKFLMTIFLFSDSLLCKTKCALQKNLHKKIIKKHLFLWCIVQSNIWYKHLL